MTLLVYPGVSAYTHGYRSDRNEFVTTDASYSVGLLSNGLEKTVVVTNTSSARTVTIPDALQVPIGWTITIKDGTGAASTHNITLSAAIPGQIESGNSKTIVDDYGFCQLTNTGTGWIVTDANPSGGGGGTAITSTEAKYIGKGQALTGLTDYISFFQDFDSLPVASASGSMGDGWECFISANASQSDGGKNSVLQLNTDGSGSGNGYVKHVQNRLHGTPNSSSPWYMAIRLAIPSYTGVSGPEVVAGVVDQAFGGPRISVGRRSANDDFTITSGSFDISFGIGFDTGFHVFEVWNPGDGKVHAQVDGANAISPFVSDDPPLQMCPVVRCYDGGQAHVYQLAVDWFMFLGTRS